MNFYISDTHALLWVNATECDPRTDTKNRETQNAFLSFIRATNMLDCCAVIFDTLQ